MPSTPLTLTVLGPERPAPALPRVLDQLGIRGPLALVSAGWRYDEERDEPLRDAVGRPVHNLRLYAAFRALERELPDLLAAWTSKQQALRRAKEQYRRAIVPAMRACQDLLAARHDPEDPWFQEAVRHLQRVDSLFLQEATRLHEGFFRAFAPLDHPRVALQRARMQEVLANCDTVMIAGGHVGVLQNRLMFYAFRDLLADKHVIAWSGGAMCLTERVLLYHDHTTLGAGLAEYLDTGLGVIRNVVFLPHARERLDLGHTDNVRILARRLLPARAVTLQNGAVLRGAALRSHGAEDACAHIEADGTLRSVPTGAPAGLEVRGA